MVVRGSYRAVLLTTIAVTILSLWIGGREKLAIAIFDSNRFKKLKKLQTFILVLLGARPVFIFWRKQHIKEHGLPCRLQFEATSTYKQIVLTPVAGFTHLCTSVCAIWFAKRNRRYHISLANNKACEDHIVRRHFQLAKQNWDGQIVCLQFDQVRPWSWTAWLNTNMQLATDPNIAALARWRRYPLHISM